MQEQLKAQQLEELLRLQEEQQRLLGRMNGSQDYAAGRQKRHKRCLKATTNSFLAGGDCRDKQVQCPLQPCLVCRQHTGGGIRGGR